MASGASTLSGFAHALLSSPGLLMIDYLDGRIEVHAGDCLDVLREMADNSIDSVVTDPPYGLEFMGKEWDSFAPQTTTARIQRTGQKGFGEGKLAKFRTGTSGGRTSHRCSTCSGWTGTFSQARAARQKKCECETPKIVPAGATSQMLAFGEFSLQWAREVFRVLKPGGHVLAFAGTRTYHRLACAIEDAGFEIRDQVGWVYGSGFPKSRDVSKAIDKAAGVEREVVGRYRPPNGSTWNLQNDVARSEVGAVGHSDRTASLAITAPATNAAREWQGWGTALKPAWEPICMARKPLSEPTVAANVLRFGTGAINVDGCRVAHASDADRDKKLAWSDRYGRKEYADNNQTLGAGLGRCGTQSPIGRWPANLILSYPEDEYELRSDVTSAQKRKLLKWMYENA